VKREYDKISLATTDHMCRYIFKHSHNSGLPFVE